MFLYLPSFPCRPTRQSTVTLSVMRTDWPAWAPQPRVSLQHQCTSLVSSWRLVTCWSDIGSWMCDCIVVGMVCQLKQHYTVHSSAHSKPESCSLSYWHWGSCSEVCLSRPTYQTWCADHTQKLYLARPFSLLSPSYSSIQPLSGPAATWLCAQSCRTSGAATALAYRLHERVVVVTNGAWSSAPHSAGHCPALA